MLALSSTRGRLACRPVKTRQRTARYPPVARDAGAAAAPVTKQPVMPRHLKDKVSTLFEVPRVKTGAADDKAAQVEPYRTLLSLDGGGMRGLVTAVVLERLEDVIKRVILEDKLIDPAKLELDGIELPKRASDFDIRLGDYFHMLAGTSTGGLIALYLGAQAECGGHAAGTAAGAIDLYERMGSRIFPTTPMAKATGVMATGAESFHPADGLEGVLKEVLKEKTMADLKTDTVITSVDAANMRTAVFFGLKSSLGEAPGETLSEADGDAPGNAPDKPAGEAPGKGTGEAPGGAPGNASDKPLGEAAGTACYFGTYKRQVKPPQLIPCRTLDPKYLCFDNINLLPEGDASQEAKAGAWLPPFTYTEANFELASVARATSAAPYFLPPCHGIRPVPASTQADRLNPNVWDDDAVFVDGGLANNDPSTIGLTVLLTAHPDTSIRETAILSIGCGVATDCTRWKETRTIFSPGRIGDLISLVMNVNGEDKASFMRAVFYGLLQQHTDQYMRIQLYTHQTVDKKVGVGYAPLVGARPSGADIALGGDTLQRLPGHASEQERRREARLQARLEAAQRRHPIGKIYLQLPLSKEEMKVLDQLDDSSEDALDVYHKVGVELADFYTLRMEGFVRNYVFGPVKPSTSPTVAPPA